MRLARWWNSLSDKKVQCYLCPRRCVINSGSTGVCRVRKNIDGKLYSLVYGFPIAIHVDPIEKKPLYHFQPGSRAFSIGTVGCNLKCVFCQNWDISTAEPKDYPLKEISPEEIVQEALKQRCQSISYTYNEPTIFGEYVLDIAKIAREYNLKNVMVTNGYITPEAIEDIYPYIDGANIDLKSFNPEFYIKMSQAKLEPVLEAIKLIHQKGTLIELTNLLIPGANDNPDEIRNLVQWVKDNLGPDVPIHFTAFHPDYKLLDRPATPKKTLDMAYKIAKEVGLNYVYEGNVFTNTEGNTYCPRCGRLLIERQFYFVSKHNLVNDRCVCGEKIPLVL